MIRSIELKQEVLSQRNAWQREACADSQGRGHRTAIDEQSAVDICQTHYRIGFRIQRYRGVTQRCKDYRAAICRCPVFEEEVAIKSQKVRHNQLHAHDLHLQERIAQTTGRCLQYTHSVIKDQHFVPHAVVVGAAVKLYADVVCSGGHTSIAAEDQTAALCFEGDALVGMNDQGNRCRTNTDLETGHSQ